MAEIEVLSATLADLDAAAIAFDAYRQFYRQEADFEGAKQFVEARLLAGDSQILLAKEGDQLLGFTQLYPSFSSVSMRRVWILNDLFVFPEARRQGVARMLMDAAKEFAQESAAVRLELATEKSNQSAQALYESMGYKQDHIFLHFSLGLSD